MKLHEISDGVAGQGSADDAALRDRAEHRPLGDICRGKPVQDGSDGPQLASPRDGDLLPLPFLICLRAPDRNAESVRPLDQILNLQRDQLGTTERAGEAQCQ